MDSNQDVASALLLYDKKNTGYPKLLEGMFHYFHDKVITKLLKLMNSPSLTKNNDTDSLIEYEERYEAKNTLSTRKNELIIKENDGLITKEYLFLRHGLRYVCSITMDSWVHRLGFR